MGSYWTSGSATATMVVVEEVEEVVEEVPPQVVLHLAARHHGEPPHRVGEEAGKGGGGHDGEGVDPEAPPRLDRVHGQAEEVGGEDEEKDGGEAREHRPQVPPAVPAHVGPEAAEKGCR